jgi:O-antigen ligase
LLAAVAMQLVPIGTETLRWLSPGADAAARALDVAYSLGVRDSHSLSIEPGLTLRALLFLALCIVWVPVCEAVLRRQGSSSRALARNLAVLGTVIAIIGLAQKATFNGKLLWFWTPQFHASNGFGPFVNRNHFAGWMLLVLAITVGLLFGRLHRVAPARGLPWRERILWLGSPAATPLLLMGAAALVMACALVWTMSRSGIAAAAVAMGILLVAGMRRAPAGLQRWAIAGFLLCTVSGVAAWRGTDTLVGWYGRTATLEWRLQLWRDTIPALGQFWVTGSGLNTYRTLMLTQPRKDLTSHPNAAHNDYLQLAVEGGVLVTVPALLVLIGTSRRIVRALRAPQDDAAWWIRMGAVAGIAGMAVQEISEFSLQIPGVALLFATALAIAVHDPAPAQSKRHARPREPAAAAA